MGMRLYRYCLCMLLVFALAPRPCAGEDVDVTWAGAMETDSQPQPQPGISFVLRGEALARSGDPFAAINEYRKAIAAGYQESDVFRSLSTVLYLSGFPEEAIDVLKEAVRLHPKEVFPQQELGVLYFAAGQDDAAKASFMSVLAVNPTLANAYYYLGLLAFRHQQYDEAWLHARRAQLLGHKASSLLDKLLPLGNEPMVDQQESVGDELCFRQILISSFEEAEGLLDRIKQGETFEVVASLSSLGSAAANGGFVGCLYPDELDPVLGASLWQMKPFSAPEIVETEGGAHVVQRVQRFDSERWRIQLAALKHPKPARKASLVGQGNEGEGKYVVHAGTYNGPVLAATMVSRLRENKFPAYVYTSPGKKGGLIYRVVAGRYNGTVDAAATVKRLGEMGVVGVVVDESEKKAVSAAEKKAVAAAVAAGGKNGVDATVSMPLPAKVGTQDKGDVALASPAKAADLPGQKSSVIESGAAAQVEAGKPEKVEEVKAAVAEIAAAPVAPAKSAVPESEQAAVVNEAAAEVVAAPLASAQPAAVAPEKVEEVKTAVADVAAAPVAPAKSAVPESEQAAAVNEAAAEVVAAPLASAQPAAVAPEKVEEVKAAVAEIAAPQETADVSLKSHAWPSKVAMSVPLVVETRDAEPAGRYTLHAGTSNNRGGAESSVTRMREAGLSAFAYPTSRGQGSTEYRLVGGRFDTLKEANAARRRLAELGIATFIANTK